MVKTLTFQKSLLRHYELLSLVTESSSGGPPSDAESSGKGADKSRVCTFSETSDINHAIFVKCSVDRSGNVLGSTVLSNSIGFSQTEFSQNLALQPEHSFNCPISSAQVKVLTATSPTLIHLNFLGNRIKHGLCSLNTHHVKGLNCDIIGTFWRVTSNS